jgi:hypothetical protein
MAGAKTENGKHGKLDVRNAANAAAHYFETLFPKVSNFSLEETELSEDEKYWFITLGFKAERGEKDAARWFDLPKIKYKIFKVDSRTGRVLSMKNRAVE